MGRPILRASDSSRPLQLHHRSTAISGSPSLLKAGAARIAPSWNIFCLFFIWGIQKTWKMGLLFRVLKILHLGLVCQRRESYHAACLSKGRSFPAGGAASANSDSCSFNLLPKMEELCCGPNMSLHLFTSFFWDNILHN